MDPIPIVQGIAGNAAWSLIKRTFARVGISLVHLSRRNSPFKATTICLRHRTNAKDQYYEGAFRSGKDVLYVSFMSQQTLKTMEPRLRDSQQWRTHLRVLTWAQDMSPEVIEAVRLHLNENKENPGRSLQQARDATSDWRQIQKTYGNVEVREYSSAPMLQGLIVGDSWALVELIPFNTMTDDRPALVLTPKSDPELFELFRRKFEDLWNANAPQPSPSSSKLPMKVHFGPILNEHGRPMPGTGTPE